MKQKLISVAYLMLFAIAAGAQLKPFKLFHQVRYNNTPSSLSPFLLSLKIGNETQLLNASDSLPNQAAIQNFALTCPAGVNVCLDLETWPYFPDAKLTKTIDKFLLSLSYFKSVNTVSPVGFYGVPPRQAYEWKNIDPVNNPGGYASFKKISDSLARLAVQVDEFQPSFYAYTPDTTSWRKMVDTTIAATKRYSTTKPIYAWIWPQYHESTTYPNQLQFIDTAIWRYELQTLYDRADGVIIWSSNKNPDGSIISWDPNMLWWQVTKSFMVQKSLVQPYVLDTFKVKRTANTEEVNWATSVDTTSTSFVVERSTDGINFQGIGTPVSRTASFYTQNTYQYIDNGTASTLYYRLKTTHLDGSVTYSQIKTAAVSGILAVLRIGGVNGTNGLPGSSSPGTAGTPIHIDKYSIAGATFTYQSSIDLPAKSTSLADTIFASSSTGEGYLVQSGNKQWMSVMGYAAKSVSGTVYSTTSNPNIARSLGLIKYDGTINISTKLSNFPVSGTAATAQASITNDGTNLWCVTNQGVSPMGVLYTTPGATDATSAPSAVVTSASGVINSAKSLSIFGGDLFYTSNSGNRIGTVSATGGLPVTAGSSVMTALPVASGSTAFSAFAPSQMVMFDLESSVLGYDVMYVTNSSATTTQAGIYKYCKNALGQWVSFGTFGSIGTDGLYFGITGEVINGLPVLYVTRGINNITTPQSTNQLIQLTESSGYNVNMGAAVTANVDATVSGMNGTLRGVAFFPAASFYYKGTGNLNDVASWGTNTNGSGTAPIDFTTDGQTFFIYNTSAASFSGDLVVSGINSKIILGDGTNVTTLTIPPTFSITAEMDVYNNAVLNIGNAQAPTLHFVAKNSTVNFMSSSAQTVSPTAFGNFSNNNNSSATINGTVTVAGNLVQNGLLKGNATLIVPNGFTNSGKVAPGNSPGLINVTGNFTNANAGIFEAELGGNSTAGSDYDQLAVSGNATLAGKLDIVLVNNFIPQQGQNFTVLTAAAVNGTFATVTFPAGVAGTITYNSTNVIVNITAIILPLHLISFTGSVLQTGKNVLEWKTADENNTNYFGVERSIDGNAYTLLQNKNAAGRGNNSYNILDEKPIAGLNYYRLKLVDRDGRFTYSNIVKLKNDATQIFSFFPNPVKTDLIITHPAADEQSYVQVAQEDGKVALKQKIVSAAVQTTVDVSKLVPGTYFVSVITGKEINTFKVVKK